VELRERTPDHVWLYNAAGFAYADAGDHRTAERWLRDGLEVAFATGDPDQVAGQLVDQLDAVLRELGEPEDEDLHARFEAFERDWKPSRGARPWHDDPRPYEPPRACAHCGFEPERTRAEAVRMHDVLARHDALGQLDPQDSGVRRSRQLQLAIAWFPADEWRAAIGRWPDLLDELPADHLEYSHVIEARTKAIARAAAGAPMSIAPLTVVGLGAYCHEHGGDPGTAEARSAYAAELARTGEVVRWPPGRNDPCWCGSATKYKRCCGPVPAAPLAEA
jgi:hypothetical protein